MHFALSALVALVPVLVFLVLLILFDSFKLVPTSMFVRALAAGVKEVFLEVRPSNVNALALYRKKGFRQVAHRRAYYQAKNGREDAAVLSLLLKSR